MSAAGQRLSVLLARAGIQPLAVGGADPEIGRVALDSRRIETGDLFIAIRGFRDDGESFVPDALRRGARAVVAASPRPGDLDEKIAWVQLENTRSAAARLSRELYARPEEALTLVGITGTNGKTTVAYMIEAMAAAAGLRPGRIGTVGSAFDGETGTAERTTPEAPDLFRLLAQMRESAVELVAMEVSSHALALSRVEGVRFAVAAFLNLSRDHLDFHDGENAYFEAKARLFDGLGPEQHAVLPAETPACEKLTQRTRARITTFGRAVSATVRLTEEACDLRASSAVLETPQGSLPIRTHLLGRVNLLNAAAAGACALAAGLPLRSIADGLLALQGVPGRVESIDRGQPFTLLVDYAHTGDALKSVLESIRKLAERKLIVLFGCGGDRDTGKRFAMGQAAAQTADLIFVTSDNPRGEDPQQILDEILVGVRSIGDASERCVAIVDREQAIRSAVLAAEAGDVVLLAGKGHETTLITGDRVEPFDDRVVAARVLEREGWRKETRAGA